MDRGRDAERVGDDDHRFFGGIDLFDHARHPILAHGLGPFGLLYAAGGGHLPLPAGLPMVRAGIGVAGNDQDMGVGKFHNGRDVASKRVEVKAQATEAAFYV
ncbi:hypothetical protein D9M72_571270 [compost metagenome]